MLVIQVFSLGRQILAVLVHLPNEVVVCRLQVGYASIDDLGRMRLFLLLLGLAFLFTLGGRY